MCTDVDVCVYTYAYIHVLQQAGRTLHQFQYSLYIEDLKIDVLIVEIDISNCYQTVK